MDEKQEQHPPMQGDDELAKALQGGLQFEETPVPAGQNAPDPLATAQAQTPVDEPPTLGTALPQPEDDEAQEEQGEQAEQPAVQHTHAKGSHTKAETEGKKDKADDSKHASPAVGTGNDALDKIKVSALEELRPLVGKLNLPPEEKFDTMLLIIRSTDDQALLDEAHAAAKSITDDTKRAEALLDIIKEIDYFSSKR